jgi:hypothetical protein
VSLPLVVVVVDGEDNQTLQAQVVVAEVEVVVLKEVKMMEVLETLLLLAHRRDFQVG